jgi:hypothetical protein
MLAAAVSHAGSAQVTDRMIEWIVWHAASLIGSGAAATVTCLWAAAKMTFQ